MNKFDAYYEAVRFLEGLSNLPLRGDYMIDRDHADVYIKRMRYFLDLIGNPERGLKFIHIAGTSGKGTVTNMVHGILHAAGKNVGSFTSPFASTSIEKIKVGGELISPDEFADIVARLKPFIDKAYVAGPYGRPSYFEIFLAIALEYFQRRGCEWAVLEVGLGGRYDATNVVNKPVVTAVTCIDYDHTEILGKTLGKIAADKAGIIKRGSVFFTTEQRPTLLKIFKGICADKGVPMNVLPSNDDYQERNKRLASAIAKHIGIDDKYVSQGISAARLPCRFEIVSKEPTVVLDGAHNRSKIGSVIENLRRLKYRRLHLVIGIADDKDHIAILERIVPEATFIYFARFQNKDRKCAHPKELLAKSRKYFKKGTRTLTRLDPWTALDDALNLAEKGDLVLVTGSFFLAGELRKRWYSEEYVLKNRNSF